MPETYRPRDADQVRETVAWAAAEERPLEIRGGGSKRGLGRPAGDLDVLDVSGLDGVTYYEPTELVLAAAAGTPLAAVEAELAGNRQRLAFEPVDYGPVTGGPAERSTVGGVLACNISGPRRVQAGAARDHCLGVTAVSGRGEAFKSGGRVVKNVTGYDLSKLMAGSHGTLAVLTEVTFKVLPVPEETRTVVIRGLDETAGIAALGRAAASGLEPTALAHLPPSAASRSAVDRVSGAGGGVTAIRIEGPAPSVEARCASSRKPFGPEGDTDELDEPDSGALWREIGGARLLPADDGVLWRLSVPPATAAGIVPEIANALPPAGAVEAMFDWAGGLIWLAIEGVEDAAHGVVRGAIAGGGGHATLIRAPEETRRRVPVFHPRDPGLAALDARVKKGFDPRGILNPGRLSADY